MNKLLKNTDSVSNFLIKHSVFIMMFAILASVAGYLTRVTLSRVLTISEFGWFYAVVAFVMSFSFFCDLNLGYILQIILPKLIKKGRFLEVKSYLITIIVWQFIVRTLIIIFLIIFSKTIAVNYFKNPELAPLIIVIALTFFVNSIGILSVGLICYKKYHYASLLNFAKMFLFLVGIYILKLFFEINLLNVGIVYLVAMIITDVLTMIIFLKYGMTNFFKLKAKASFKKFKFVFKKNIPLALTQVSIYLFGIVDVLVITFFRTSEELGLYQMALPTVAILSVLIISPISLMMPSFLSQLEKNAHAKTIIDIEKTVIFLTLPIIVIGLIIAPFLLSIIFKQDGIFITNIFRVLLVNQIIIIFFQIYFYIFIGNDQMKYLLKCGVVVSILLLLSSVILTYLIGTYGTILAYFLSYGLYVILLRRKLRLIIKERFPIAYLLKVMLCLFIAAIPSFFIIGISENYFIKIFLASSSFILIFISLSLIIGTIDKTFILKLFLRKSNK